jgi:hypothetical protein
MNKGSCSPWYRRLKIYSSLGSGARNKDLQSCASNRDGARIWIYLWIYFWIYLAELDYRGMLGE